MLEDHSPVKVLEVEETERGWRLYERNFQRIARSGYEARGFVLKVFLLQGLQACFLMSGSASGTGEQCLHHRAGTWTSGYCSLCWRQLPKTEVWFAVYNCLIWVDLMYKSLTDSRLTTFCISNYYFALQLEWKLIPIVCWGREMEMLSN